ncbi:RagB/SusD family nutrient uptake outer membrane protein [Pontibacter qinzhouensis]|uniref:RagB/SusD family nutrient uptake outer membrane protein n=1 Tax=Pontibacter qinzhouensis TaxID=2603253 RepID=A0A5C8JG62_9BACT|nr:RagB/SusD family nutrient uptake outer membrane protein [Pontibacter qinzhouensis]TXK36719.1 RagB/SusD family nutrient uptake outer membrane protein [Pontibacter qinzhouensis]
MKSIIKYTATFLFAATLSSCENYLDRTPLDTINPQNFYKTQTDAIAAINGAYQPLQWPKLYNFQIWGTDIWAGNSIVGAGGGTDGIATQDVANFVTTTANAAALDLWRGPSPGILRANVVLKYVPGIEMEENLKNRILGEAKFLRGLYYFILVQAFGDVPLITDAPDTPTNEYLYPARTPKEQVYNQIVQDLAGAIELLPVRETYSGADIGRASKGAATGLLAKVYLTIGNYQKTVELCEQVTAMGYSLNPDYSDNFNPLNKNGPESLFEVQYAGKVNTADFFGGNEQMASWVSTYTGPRNSNMVAGAYGWNQPTQEFVNQYETGDVRKDKTILYEGGPAFDGQEYKRSYSMTGYNLRKFLVPKSISPEYNTNPANFPVLRYADVLLMQAEALYELGRTNEAQASASSINSGGPLNRVRVRAGLPTIGGLSQSALRAAIRKERRLELAFEGHHWFDIIRYDNGQYFAPYLHAIGKTNASAKHRLLPIPQQEMDANQNLVQNSGY